MCYHTRRREALARLEHETGPREATEDRTDARESDDDHDPTEEHQPENPTPDRTRRPEPVGFA
ncbi:hypothetical protein [Halobellus salinisoli]|uniref:hypothetical protein n=1 Tax=Halobellus salinisoli TaxID=3108500 RepID=UPI0030084F58